MPPKPSEKRMQHFREMLAYDQAHLGFGASLAGMDEVGRGPLVGDVVTACVILPAEPVFPWVDDSKIERHPPGRSLCPDHGTRALCGHRPGQRPGD